MNSRNLSLHQILILSYESHHFKGFALVYLLAELFFPPEMLIDLFELGSLFRDSVCNLAELTLDLLHVKIHLALPLLHNCHQIFHN